MNAYQMTMYTIGHAAVGFLIGKLLALALHGAGVL